MKRCKGVVSLDYVVKGKVIVPLIFQIGEPYDQLWDDIDSGKLELKSKMRKRGA